MDAQFNQLEGNRKVKLYDDTQKVLQANDNFKNWRIAQQAALQNAALTNRANTFNLNTTYDNYAVDPRTGGMVGMTNSRGLERTGSVADREARKQQYFNDMAELDRELGRKATGPEIEGYLEMIGGMPRRDRTNYQQEASESGFGSYPSAALGKEIKRMAVPFYTGKMGR